MKIPIILVAICVFVFYIIVPMLIWYFARNSKVGKIITTIFAIQFGIILLLGITSRIAFEDKLVIINFDFSAKCCDKVINCSLLNVDKVDFLINVIMLIPVGLIVVYFNHKSILNKLLVLFVVGFVCGFALETLQFVLPVVRSVQLSDVLLNTLSVLLGGWLGLVYDCIIRTKRKK